MSASLVLGYDGDVATLTLASDNPRHPPTLDRSTLDRLDEACAELEKRAATLRLLWVRSASPKFFCVGADINALATIDAETIVPWVQRGHEVFNRLERLPLPVVARIEGFALGGGLELAMACDLIFAADAAQFGQTEARLGFVAGWGGSYRLPRRVGMAKAKELFFTSRLLSAAEAAAIGLVEFAGSPEALEQHCARFAADLAATSATSAAGHKRLVARAAEIPLAAASALEATASVDCLSAPDTRQRLTDFLSRKK